MFLDVVFPIILMSFAFLLVLVRLFPSVLDLLLPPPPKEQDPPDKKEGQ